jgi:V/A-type H+-transporting ATPase subunit C
MMHEISYPFAVGRIKSLEKNLLDATVWQQLNDANDENTMLKILKEYGYGSQNEDYQSISKVVASEMDFVDHEIKSLTPAPALTDLFYLHEDAYNIKLLLKGKLLKRDVKMLLHPSGVIDLKLLLESFINDKWNDLPLPIAKTIEQSLNLQDPFEISVAIDKTILLMIKEALSHHKNQLIERYFAIQFDSNNILSVIRGNALGWPSSKINSLLIPGGSLEIKTIKKAIGKSEDQLFQIFSFGPNRFEYKEILEDYAKDHQLFRVEERLDDLAFSIIHEQKNDSFGIGPVINYLLQKRREASSIRIIAAKK